MRHIKNVLLSYYPDLAFLSSSSNKHNVDDDLETMGAKLAIEVKDYIN